MNDIFSMFTEKFKVPERLKNQVHKILSEKEIIILNYLADKEETISNINSEFPLLEYSLIESLYKRGYLIRQSKKSEIFYKTNTFDHILKRFVNDNPKYQELHHKEKSLFQEFISEIFLKEMKASKKPVYRVVPIEKTLKDKRQLIPFHQAAHFLQKSPAIALIDCICRTTFNKCDKPRKVCLVLGDQAEFFIDRGIGEKIDSRRGLEVLDIAEKNGLVHSIDNKEDPDFLCNCCECCCVFVQALKKRGIFTSLGKSGFIAVSDQELCDQCGICVDKCIFEAISIDGESIKFDENKCFGCGLCAYNCPQKAISLIHSENVNDTLKIDSESHSTDDKNQEY